ncbi:hypothetical protein GOBAR_DD06599 [Gossypium barbadense]|nr:hypothetical protein GOBAR_DD06599 [Gossypium barbadense]
MAPRKGQLGSINAPSFETKKDEAPSGFIYEVPRNIRQANPKAYTPLLISIVDYKDKFLQRTFFFEKALESFWSFIERNEKNIFSCYEALIDEDEFVKMIFYDALFIVELFLRNYEKEVEKNSDIKDLLLKETWSVCLRRVILLENQIPMFVLEELYKPYENHKLASDASVPSFLKLACSYFDIPWDLQFEHIEIPHFTALQRCHMTKTQNPSSKTKIPTLKKVYGQEVVRKSKESKHEGRLVTIINTNIAVQRMIKKLMVGIGQPCSACYRVTANRLNQLYKEARKRKVTLFIKENYGILKRVYFPNLWRGTRTVTAFMVVVFTFTQTVLAFVKD